MLTAEEYRQAEFGYTLTESSASANVATTATTRPPMPAPAGGRIVSIEMRSPMYPCQTPARRRARMTRAERTKELV